MFAQRDSEIPNKNATRANHRPLPRWPRHNSTVANINNPSTINGQIAAVVPSAPNRKANTRPC